MATKQTRYRQKRFAEGYRQITLLLPGPAVEELDRRVSERHSSRVSEVESWLVGDESSLAK